MLRYTKLGAGASWIGEYGDPAIAEQRAWIEGYSPYQKLVAGKTYPAPLILTSTKDDRVHPARPQSYREARCAGPALLLLREHRRGTQRRGQSHGICTSSGP
nr:hypothetical protein [Bradyrhizobium sp. CCBAU 65884]